MGREVFALDIDDVSFPFVEHFLYYHNRTYGTTLTPADVTNSYNKALGLSGPEVARRIYSFHQEEDLHIPPVDGAQEAVEHMATRGPVFAVSSRHPMFQSRATRWLDKAFPGMIAGVVLIGHPSEVPRSRTKLEVCRELGATVMVDDTRSHLVGCDEYGVRGAWFGRYAWQPAEQAAPAGAIRCFDWDAVEEMVDGG